MTMSPAVEAEQYLERCGWLRLPAHGHESEKWLFRGAIKAGLRDAIALQHRIEAARADQRVGVYPQPGEPQ